ncbi:MAG: outer membrane lipoprotein-sorting protein [Elusimicrobia bacterium]|nr:outer membrane lipoprotein-sorting protein [Elusimicrobiota bacterium]
MMGLLLSISLCLGAACAQEPPQPSAAVSSRALSVLEMVDRSNKVLRGDSSHARLAMTIVTPEWTRKLDIEAWNQGRVKALILIHAPPKEKGTATLRRGSEMWTWMPRVERLMKVPPTMMHSSWHGSDFTYEDIVKADSVVKDYTHRVLRRERGREYESVHIEALPKPDAPVVWGKVLLKLAVYPDDWVIPLGEEDYSERGELMRVIALSRIQPMDGRLVPTRLECRPQRHPGRRTVLDYHGLQFDLKLEDSFFSLSRLQK